MEETIERIQLKAIGRGEAIKICTEAMCVDCCLGTPLMENETGKFVHQYKSGFFKCKAGPIWIAIRRAGWK